MFDFNHNLIKYDKKHAWYLAQLSMVVYCNWEDVAKCLDTWHLNYKFYDDKKTDTQAMLLWSNDYAIIVSRGTSSIRDINTDINLSLKEWSLGKVHGGALDSYLSIRKDMLSDIGKLRTGTKIWITGHSLGALVSMITFADLVSLGYTPMVYTFGAPMVGDNNFSKTIDIAYSNSVHRYVNNNDKVPNIFFQRVSGFKHCGNLHYFTEDGKQEDNLSLWGKIKDRLNGVVHDAGESGLDCIKDHFISEYVYRCYQNK